MLNAWAAIWPCRSEPSTICPSPVRSRWKRASDAVGEEEGARLVRLPPKVHVGGASGSPGDAHQPATGLGQWIQGRPFGIRAAQPKARGLAVHEARVAPARESRNRCRGARQRPGGSSGPRYPPVSRAGRTHHGRLPPSGPARSRACSGCASRSKHSRRPAPISSRTRDRPGSGESGPSIFITSAPQSAEHGRRHRALLPDGQVEDADTVERVHQCTRSRRGAFPEA